ncbi:hypothetical protein ACWGOQ_0020515 [Aquimarina sp. M1]
MPTPTRNTAGSVVLSFYTFSVKPNKMTKIKLLIKAFVYLCDDDENETVQNEPIKKGLTDFSLIEKDLRHILGSLIIYIKEINDLYPDEQTNVIYKNDNRLERLCLFKKTSKFLI